MSASNAMAATAHGTADEMVLASAEAAGLKATGIGVPAAVPQRWQNRAPGVRRERQPEHVASPSAAPHSEQKRPVTDAPQLGQVAVSVFAEAMGRNIRRTLEKGRGALRR